MPARCTTRYKATEDSFGYKAAASRCRRGAQPRRACAPALRGGG
jgi:hypothetical protein